MKGLFFHGLDFEKKKIYDMMVMMIQDKFECGDKMKKILFVVDERRMGGVSILLESILGKLNKKKFQIDVLILHNNGELLNHLDSKIKVIYGTPYFEAIDYSIKDVLKMKNLSLLWKKIRVVWDMKTGRIEKRIQRERKKILKEHYDVEVAFKDGFTALFTAFGDSTKKVHWLHYEYEKLNPNGKYPKLFEKAFLNIDQIVAVSQGVMDCFNRIYHLEDKTMVIKNLVEIDRIRAKGGEAVPKKEQLHDSKIHFVSVGRLHPQKGYHQLIEAVSKLKEEKLLKNCSFRIYGAGSELKSLENLVNQYELHKYISFEGERMNPFPYVKASDMFILSSIYEPFGLVIVESMALGVPVLATANAATGELIQDGKNGMIVENSVDGLYHGLKSILKHPEKINDMKQQLLEYQYPIEHIIKEIEGVLEH